MATRLGSAKGSFVQSAKKAFETVAVAGYFIEGDVTANAGALIDQEMISGGDCQPNFLSVGDYDMIYTALSTDGGTLPAGPGLDLSLGVFTDITSGDTFDMAAAPYNCIQACIGVNNWGYWDTGLPPIAGTETFIVTHTANTGAINIATNHGIIHPVFTALGRWRWDGPAP